MSVTLTAAEIDVMRHTLGLDRAAEAYRNYFCAEPGHADMPTILDLVAKGLMRSAGTINDGRDTIYRVTEPGRMALDRQPVPAS